MVVSVPTHRLGILATHPVQYHAPVYRALQQNFDIPVTVIYGSDFSVAGYRDPEFGASVRWDTDLLSGYTSIFLENVAEEGVASTEAVSGKGIHAILQQIRPDVLLLTGYQGAFHRQAWIAALQSKIPILFRAETNDDAVQRNKIKQWGRDALLRLLYSRCTALLPIGVQSRRHYERLALQKPMYLSPYCVDVTPFQTDEAARSRWRNTTRAMLGVQEGQVAILFSGKLIAKKNPLLLIRAIQQLPEEVRANLVLLFLGDGELRPQIEAMVAKSPMIVTRFIGFQNQTALSPYYHAADLLVLPSAFGETWGLVVNEALHHGVPALVSDRVGCALDLIVSGKTGEVFPSESVEGLAQALQAMMPLVGSSKTRTECRAQIEGYTVNSAAEGIATAFREVVRGTG
jgi:glycosyltransferase involved in cell wall biosynthesis